MNGQYLRETDYPAVRRVMGADRHRLDDDAVEDLLTELFPDADPEDVEDFMGSVQTFARQAAPVAQRALPGVIKGATQGAMVGGPMGLFVGAGVGAAGSLLQRGAPGASAPAPAVPPTLPPRLPGAASNAGPGAASTAVPGAASTAPPDAASNAAAELLAILFRPETIEALFALFLSGSGRPTIEVGQKQVPAAAFADAIAEAAALVAEAAAPFDGPATEYLFDSAGEPRVDIANPAERAALLLSELAAVAAAEAWDDEVEEAYDDSSTETDEGFGSQDPIDSYEAALGDGADYEY
jgi:hypothetical protein